MGFASVTPGISAPLSSPLSDEEVVARVLGGDGALYEVLMRRYNQRLFRIARAILLNDHEAEDVMQDTYVRAYAALDQFAGRAKFSTWLTKIAIYEALRRSRIHAREHPAALTNETDESMKPLKSSRLDPEQETQRKETALFLEQAVDSLPDIYRSVFVLREIENMSTAETACCLDLTEETVKVRLLRARQALRKDLYSRVGATSSQAFAFMGTRCDRVVRNVFERLKQMDGGTAG